MQKLPSRKGARRRSEIPSEVLQALNQGKIETANLVEWLAIDMSVLLQNALTQAGWQDHQLHKEALRLQEESITKRLEGMGKAIKACEKGSTLFETFANHTSDMVRAWAAFAIAANPDLSLTERLSAMYRFAADQNMSVRECAWSAFRPYLVQDLDKSFGLLTHWVKDSDANIRRCAVEATRPCGVWCQHITALKKNPEPGLTLLEFVRSDSSNYVQRSVANWLNDASKSCPSWVMNVCQRWQQESPTKETAWIINHALRTLKKKAFFQ